MRKTFLEDIFNHSNFSFSLFFFRILRIPLVPSPIRSQFPPHITTYSSFPHTQPHTTRFISASSSPGPIHIPTPLLTRFLPKITLLSTPTHTHPRAFARRRSPRSPRDYSRFYHARWNSARCPHALVFSQFGPWSRASISPRRFSNPSRSCCPYARPLPRLSTDAFSR